MRNGVNKVSLYIDHFFKRNIYDSIIDFKNKNRIITPRLLLRPIVKNDTELIVEWRNHLAKEQILIFLTKRKS